MSLLDLLNHRRSVRHYDENQPIDADVCQRVFAGGSAGSHKFEYAAVRALPRD